MITVKDFILKTDDSYAGLSVREYEKDECIRKIDLEKRKWHCSDIPEDLLNMEITSIVPFYDKVILEVDKQ